MANLEAALTDRSFGIRWILASAVGMAVAAAVARPLSYLVGSATHDALGPVFGEAIVGVVAGGGTLGGVALAQWPLLRRRVAWAARWPAAGAASMVVPGSVHAKGARTPTAAANASFPGNRSIARLMGHAPCWKATVPRVS